MQDPKSLGLKVEMAKRLGVTHFGAWTADALDYSDAAAAQAMWTGPGVAVTGGSNNDNHTLSVLHHHRRQSKKTKETKDPSYHQSVHTQTSYQTDS